MSLESPENNVGVARPSTASRSSDGAFQAFNCAALVRLSSLLVHSPRPYVYAD